MSETKQQHLTCYECGRLFDPKKQALKTAKDYNLTAAGPLCRNRPECRGRILAKSYDERGLRRWARHTQEQLLAVMDVPPTGWDKKKSWESVHLFHERLAAAVEFFSVCWPVCLPYAVQTDADGEPIKEFGEWKRHTHRSLAAVLHVPQSSVARAIAYLKRRNLLTEADGRLYAEANPKSLNSQERESCTRISEPNLKDLAALPRKTLKTLTDLWPLLEPDVCTRIKAAAIEACKQLNRDISDARTEASRKVLDACHPHVSLLSRLGDYKQKRAGGRANPVVSGTPPPEEPPACPPEVQPEEPKAAEDQPAPASLKAELAKRKIFTENGRAGEVLAELGATPVAHFLDVLDDRLRRGRIGSGLVVDIAKKARETWLRPPKPPDEDLPAKVAAWKWIAENDEESEARDYAIKQLLDLEIPLARKAAS